MRPFVESPFFIPNPLLAAAAIRLRHAVTLPGGIAVVSGGPGVGKSAFVRHALAPVAGQLRLLPVDVRHGESEDLLVQLAAGLGAEPGQLSGPGLLFRILELLRSPAEPGTQPVIVLDVAGLNVELARRLLRLVSVSGELPVPVSIILQGPHTLHAQLDVPGMIQMRQRVSFRTRYRPFTLLETAGYLRNCLSAAGREAEALLTVSAPASAYLYTGGVPRLINTLVDAALGELQARQLQRIDPEVVRVVADQLGWKPKSGTPPGTRPAQAPPAAVSRIPPVFPAPAPAPAPAPVPASLPAVTMTAAAGLPTTEITGRLLAPDLSAAAHARTHVPDPASSTPAVVLTADETSPAARSGINSAVPPMDPNDHGATGMLRLEDLDERFAETLFSEDSGHFKILIGASRAD